MYASSVINRVLGDLSPTARQTVELACRPVSLASGTALALTGKPTEHIYFIEAGFLSVIAGEDSRTGVEVGLIGREGMSGSWLALGQVASPFRVVVQGAGTALRMSAASFDEACGKVPELKVAVLAFSHEFTATVAETCRANARLTIEARLARWLLQALGRLDTNELPITHDTLARMLGVRRPGITVALHMLEGDHMIKATRGLIKILDAERLGFVAKGLGRRVETVSPRPHYGMQAVA